MLCTVISSQVGLPKHTLVVSSKRLTGGGVCAQASASLSYVPGLSAYCSESCSLAEGLAGPGPAQAPCWSVHRYSCMVWAQPKEGLSSAKLATTRGLRVNLHQGCPQPWQLLLMDLYMYLEEKHREPGRMLSSSSTWTQGSGISLNLCQLNGRVRDGATRWRR